MLFLDDVVDLRVDWDWDLYAEVKRFDELWREGVSIDRIASILNRPLLSVQILKCDRILRGKIKDRPFGDYGNVEAYLKAFGEAVKLNVKQHKREQVTDYAKH